MDPRPSSPLLRVRDLAVSFGNQGGQRVQAVDGVSLSLHAGQTLAVVGESGSGKSVSALATLGLVPMPPGKVDRGQILFRRKRGGGEVDLLRLPASELARIRGGEIAMIFQEPMTCLNPVFTVGDQIIEAIRLHREAGKGEAREIAARALAEVGIVDAPRRLSQYPHEFSGGMRQRVMIAMALACEPRVLLADEPTTALDVTIQKQILGELASLKRERGLAIMLITHDLGVVAENADVVCVVYAGRVVEYAAVDELFRCPLHPYTRGLLACIPRLGRRPDRLVTVREVVDEPTQFEMRARGVAARAWWPWHDPPGADATDLVEVEPGHWVAIWAGSGLTGSEPDLACVRADAAAAPV